MPAKTTKVRSQVTLNPLTWYRAGVTFDGTTATLYVNGAAVATAPVVTPLDAPSVPELRFGQSAGTMATAVRFDGVDDFISVPHAAVSTITGSTFTLEAWVKIASQSSYPLYQYVVSKFNDFLQGSMVLGLVVSDGRKIGYCALGPAGVFGSTELPVNTWFHLAMVYDGALLRLYVNGSPDGTAALTGNLAWSSASEFSNHINFGGFYSSQYCKGDLAEVRIWSTARTAEQIMAGMNQVTAPQTGLNGIWRLDDGSGTTANDVSGNAYHGTLTNGPTWITAIGDLTIGELRIWTTVRTPAEIASNLDNITPPQAGLLALYNFDETSGETAADSSTNGHAAALSGTWQWESEDFSGAFAYAGKAEVNLSWDPIAGAESYNVKRSEVTGGPYTLIGTTHWPTYRDVNVVVGTAYYYKVFAVAQGVEGAASTELSAIPAAAPAETAAQKWVVLRR